VWGGSQGRDGLSQAGTGQGEKSVLGQNILVAVKMGMLKDYLAQGTLDALLNLQSRIFVDEGRFRVLRRLRRWLINHGDPLVTFQFEGTTLLAPISHELPLTRKRLPHYSANLGRIAAHLLTKYPDLSVIDIGANIGDSAAIIRRMAHVPILCIEGNARYFELLKKNVAHFGEVYPVQAFVGSATGQVRGRIQAWKGTGSIVLDEQSSQTIPMKTLSTVLEAYPQFRQSKLLKLDTDGFDVSILHSELELLGRLRPVLFFEYSAPAFSSYEDESFTIFEALQKRGYRALFVYEETGEYSLCAHLDNSTLVQDIHRFYSDRRDKRYSDLCVFHGDDADLCQSLRLAELDYFGAHPLARA
jgi:FkbM family methyltransferase